jgi:hypothetical protein
MMCSSMYPTPYFRIAAWTEEVKVPKKDASRIAFVWWG